MINVISKLLNLDQHDIEMENQSKILQTIIDNVPELIFFKDKYGVYREANKICRDFYNARGIDEIIGKRDMELDLDREFLENCKRHDEIVMKSKKPLSFEEEFKNSDGTIEIFETVKNPVINDKSEVLGIVGVVRNITSRKAEERKLRYLSYTDILTGLYNRAFFSEKMQGLINNNSFPIGIIMGDVNGLKLVNDTFGHIAGDNLIVKIADYLKNICKNNEMLFRWGGDEFIILIPECNGDECKKLINKINLALASSSEEYFNLSMSMGYSIMKYEKSSIDNSLREAEEKLYRQKILIGKSIRSSNIKALQESLAARNVETAEHTERVLKYSLKTGEKLGLNQEVLDELTLVAKLHDIGKIAIPENILLKPSKLTDDEFEIMKTHSERGYRLAMTMPELNHIAKGILSHHERWDGNGYPFGLAGNDIPLVSRIISIVDSYDAMTSNRAYNIVKTKEEAIEELKRCAGYQFDPKITEIFCAILKEESCSN